MGRQQTERQLPHDASFGIGKAMELVHHDSANIGEIERGRRGAQMGIFPVFSVNQILQMGAVAVLAMQQTVQQNLGYHDQHAGVGILAAVAGHQSDVFRLKTPFDRGRLHFAKLLLAQRNQRRGVVRGLSCMQGLEQCRLGDQRLAGAGRCANQHPLVGRKPCQERLFLNLVRLERKLIEIATDKFVAGGNARHVQLRLISKRCHIRLC